jgi:hypothetical protein
MNTLTSVPTKSGQIFYVVMQKRRDDEIYVDLHKTTEKIYLLEEDAEYALNELGFIKDHCHIVKLIAYLYDSRE